MAVVVLRADTNAHEETVCVICLHTVPLSEVTAGSYYADGDQAFACNKHLLDRTRWISEWAAFEGQQRVSRELALEPMA